MTESVTRAEFVALVDIVNDLATALVGHTHGMDDGSDYGGATYRPDNACWDALAEIRKRLADIAPTDPASPLSRGDG